MNKTKYPDTQIKTKRTVYMTDDMWNSTKQIADICGCNMSCFIRHLCQEELDRVRLIQYPEDAQEIEDEKEDREKLPELDGKVWAEMPETK